MPRILKNILLVLMLGFSAPKLAAFSLGGPLPDNPGGGGEAWQVDALGYDPFNTDINAPKNLGEEYRWNQPLITYGFDKSFLDYFGTNGVAAVDSAFRIINRAMTNIFNGPHT